MTANELSRRYPNASRSFIKANADSDDSRLHSVQPKPDERMPLDDAHAGKEACWYDAAECFEILFVVHAQRPCDWDGYDIKALQDFCVTAGIIPNDGWKTLSGRVVSKKVAKKEQEKTEIIVTPI